MSWPHLDADAAFARVVINSGCKMWKRQESKGITAY
jgi:hypothetical protein